MVSFFELIDDYLVDELQATRCERKLMEEIRVLFRDGYLRWTHPAFSDSPEETSQDQMYISPGTTLFDPQQTRLGSNEDVSNDTVRLVQQDPDIMPGNSPENVPMEVEEPAASPSTP